MEMVIVYIEDYDRSISKTIELTVNNLKEMENREQ